MFESSEKLFVHFFSAEFNQKQKSNQMCAWEIEIILRKKKKQKQKGNREKKR